MSYKFDFTKITLGATQSPLVDVVELDEKTVEDIDLHTYTYVRASGRRPDNCVAVYHTDQGDWWELDVGPESRAGQREFPLVKLISIERLST